MRREKSSEKHHTTHPIPPRRTSCDKVFSLIFILFLLLNLRCSHTTKEKLWVKLTFSCCVRTFLFREVEKLPFPYNFHSATLWNFFLFSNEIYALDVSDVCEPLFSFFFFSPLPPPRHAFPSSIEYILDIQVRQIIIKNFLLFRP
jgi:hypothetical protein